MKRFVLSLKQVFSQLMALASGMAARARSEENAFSFLNAFLVDARFPHKVSVEEKKEGVVAGDAPLSQHRQSPSSREESSLIVTMNKEAMRHFLDDSALPLPLSCRVQREPDSAMRVSLSSLHYVPFMERKEFLDRQWAHPFLERLSSRRLNPSPSFLIFYRDSTSSPTCIF